MRKTLLSLVAVLLFVLGAAAQDHVITGRVVNDKNQPVEGVSVTGANNKYGTQTAKDGTYSIKVPANVKTLTFSSVDFAATTQNVPGNSNTLNVFLSAANKSLDEVIVVAYGTVKKGEATSAIANVKAEDIKNRPLTNVTSALEGAAPGIQMLSANGQPGSSQTIRLRGFGSINAGSDPLFVVDGAPYAGPISGINMDDVESISALKDASSVALYGSRAANGVVIITTKKGKRNRNNISFKVAYGTVSRGLNEYKRVGVNDYYPLMWQAYRNALVYGSGQTLAVASQNATNGIKGALGYNPYNVANNAIVGTDGKLNPAAQLIYGDDLDWNKDIIRQGARNEYSLNYSGGSDKSDYLGSFSYVKEQGFSIKSDLGRFTGRINLNTNPVSWFKTGINLAASMSNSNTAQDGTSTAYVNPFNFIRNIGPIYPVHAHDVTTGAYLVNALGQHFYDYGNLTALGLPARPAGASAGRHIAEETNLNENLFKRNLYSARTYGTINFLKELSFTTSISVDVINYQGSTFGNKIVGDAAPAGRASKEDYTTQAYTFNQIVNYGKTFGNHTIAVLAGHENYEIKKSDVFLSRSGQIFDGNIELGNFAVPVDNTSYVDTKRIESYLSKLTYDYKSKYFVTGSLRRDGNSVFKQDQRWDNFWSVGLGWRVDKENFMRHIPQVSSLKLRTSYGKLGNDADLYYYSYQGLYGLGYNNGAEPGVVQTNLKNDSIKWETSKNFDVAAEFSLFKNRINGSVEYYYKLTDGLLFSVPQPIANGGTTTGGYSITKNIGELYNKGFEFHLDGDVIRSKNADWNIGVNASTTKNRITKMPPLQPTIINGTKRLEVGHSIYDYWLRDWQGVDPADGVGLYRADNGTLALSRVRKAGDTLTPNQNNARFIYAGSAIPKVYGSITTSFRYKNFEVSAVMAYQIGGKVYDGIYAGLMDNGTNYGSAQSADALLAWKQAGDITSVPRMDAGPKVSGTSVQFNAASSRWLIDASYFNIRSLGMSYNLPKSFLTHLKASSARLYLNGENLGLFTKRQGLNPQQSFTGVTSNAYPPSRVITIGVNVNF